MDREDVLEGTYKRVKEILDAKLPLQPFLRWNNPMIRTAVFVAVGYSIGKGEKRKGSGLPIWSHLYNSAILGELFWLGPGDIVALWLHDILEDSAWTEEDLRIYFSDYSVNIVKLLTQKDRVEGVPRADRIAEYHDTLENANATVQSCKLIESLTNVYVIVDDAPSFAPVFLNEKLDLYNRLTKAHPVLRDVFKMFLDDAFEKLNANKAV